MLWDLRHYFELGYADQILEIADWRDILSVLHETVHIWSAGLSPIDYHYFLSCQLSDPWFRRKCRIFVLKEGDIVQASCKLYSLEFSARGQIFRLAGLGAVYTQKAFRSMGLASELINDVIDLCEEEELDGIVLYSEIDPEFYEGFGFEELGSAEFSLMPAESAQLLQQQAYSVASPPGLLQQVPLTADLIPKLSRHYSRWLREQPFGVHRSEPYWHYKVFKEQFLSQRSTIGRPGLNLIKFDLESCSGGYAITESSRDNLRILEVVGSDTARKIIWANLLTQILKGDVKRLRGWEAVIRDLAPTYKVRDQTLYFSDRDWGRGMILCLNAALRSWLSVNPNPMLEFDHL